MRILVFIIVVCAALIGLLSPKPPPALFPYIGFVLHCFGFVVLSLSARLAFNQAPAHWLWGTLIVSAPLAEYLQLLQPLRSFSQQDIYANLLGVILAAIIWLLCSVIKKLLTTRHAIETRSCHKPL